MRPQKDASNALDSSADVSIQIQRFDLVHSPETKRDKRVKSVKSVKWVGVVLVVWVVCFFWIAGQVLYTSGVDTWSNAARPRWSWKRRCSKMA